MSLKDTFFEEWKVAVGKNQNAVAYDILSKARKAETKEDVAWMIDALKGKETKFFVAALFLRKPVSKRVFPFIVYAALVDCDASRNKLLLMPCLETFGREKVLAEVQKYSKDERVISNRGIEKAMYWLNMQTNQSRSGHIRGDTQDLNPDSTPGSEKIE